MPADSNVDAIGKALEEFTGRRRPTQTQAVIFASGYRARTLDQPPIGNPYWRGVSENHWHAGYQLADRDLRGRA